MPHALRNQLGNLAVINELFAQHQCLGHHHKFGESRSKSRYSQHAQWVFGKCVADMPKHFRFNVARAAKWIDKLVDGVDYVTMNLERHRIDGEIASLQISFECDVRRRVKCKPRITTTALALGSRERIFLVGLRVQKHRKVFAHGQKFCRQHVIDRRAHHHVITVMRRQPQELVPYAAADLINLHHAIIDG